MGKFKAVYKPTLNDSDNVTIGTYNTKDIAISEGYQWLREHGCVADIDTKEFVTTALNERNYCLLINAPREIVVEEV